MSSDGGSGIGGGSSSIFGSMHRDVLMAPRPDTINGRQSLVSECKSRAKGAVQSQSWPDAMELYDKALSVLKGDDEEEDVKKMDEDVRREISILYANLSLCHGKMNQWMGALGAAENSVDVDDTYVKGWWRMSQAQSSLKQYDPAIHSMERANALEPNNKALQKELSKLKETAKEIKEKGEPISYTANIPNNKATTTKTNSTTATTKSSSTSTTTKKKKDDKVVMKDESVFTKSDHVKGYKIVNGKKTSYFHNELSDDAKKLIGDIAPKKLETNAGENDGTAKNATNGAQAMEVSDSSTSAWNKAGTWEERDVTTWGKESLIKALKQARYVLPTTSPAPDATVEVTRVECQGHASVAAVRGKKRYIYEWSPVTVTWQFEHDPPMEETVTQANGTLVFSDVDGTCMVGDPYDVSSFTIKDASDEHVRPVLDAFVHRGGLRNELHKQIDAWVNQFRETY